MTVGRHFLVSLSAAAILSSCAHAGMPDCPTSPRADAEIDQTVHAFYDALRADDPAAFRRVTTFRFYAFDGGQRYDGTALVDLVRDAHAKGVQLNWSVGPLDTQRRCDIAWTAWENVGSVGTPSGVKPVRWLESAVLVRQDGKWKIDFFHSQRATAK